MTLLDAPEFDEARERRRRTMIESAAGLVLVLFIGWWLVAGRPVDWPWNWNNHLLGRMAVNEFLTAVEKNDLPTAYGIWIHDKNWQQHPAQDGAYPFRALREGLEPDQPGQRIRRHSEPQDRGGAHVWKRAADGGADQRAQEQGAQSGLRPQDAHAELLAAGCGDLPAEVAVSGELKFRKLFGSTWLHAKGSELATACAEECE